MNADPTTRSRLGLWLGLAAGAVLLLIGAALVLWFMLPRWAPLFVIQHSPWIEPVLMAEMAGRDHDNDNFTFDGPRAKAIETRRREFFQRLEHWPIPVPATLLRRAADPRSNLRLMAIESLGHIGDRSVVASLIALLSDGDDEVRIAARDALVATHGRDPTTLGLLLPALTSQDPAARRTTAECLGALNDLGAVAPLIAALADRDVPVRHAAIIALGQLKDPRAVGPLIAILADADAGLRRSAVSALAQHADPRVVEALIAALGDSDSPVRQVAAVYLGQLGDRRAVIPLLAVLVVPDDYARWAAADALAALHDPRAVQPLLAEISLADDPAVMGPLLRRHVIEVLGTFALEPDQLRQIETAKRQLDGKAP